MFQHSERTTQKCEKYYFQGKGGFVSCRPCLRLFKSDKNHVFLYSVKRGGFAVNTSFQLKRQQPATETLCNKNGVHRVPFREIKGREPHQHYLVLHMNRTVHCFLELYEHRVSNTYSGSERLGMAI